MFVSCEQLTRIQSDPHCSDFEKKKNLEKKLIKKTVYNKAHRGDSGCGAPQPGGDE